MRLRRVIREEITRTADAGAGNIDDDALSWAISAEYHVREVAKLASSSLINEASRSVSKLLSGKEFTEKGLMTYDTLMFVAPDLLQKSDDELQRAAQIVTVYKEVIAAVKKALGNRSGDLTKFVERLDDDEMKSLAERFGKEGRVGRCVSQLVADDDREGLATILTAGSTNALELWTRRLSDKNLSESLGRFGRKSC